MEITWLSINEKTKKALYLQIADLFVQNMMNGYLKKGDRLPSIRACAKQLQVSLTSVKNAYAKLQMEGYIESVDKKGFYVAMEEEHLLFHKEILQSSRIAENKTVRYDFRSGALDETTFDYPLWKRCMKDAMEHGDIMRYGDAQGEYLLRVALQKYAYATRGVLCHPEQIIVGASVQSLLYQLCSLFEGKQKILMDREYLPQAVQVFQDFGYKLTFEYLEELSKTSFYHHDLMYINTASFGKHKEAISKKQALEYLRYAKEGHCFLIEDDKNGVLCYQRKPQMALQGMDLGEQVIYLGTFSKILLPSLRIAYMVLPKKLIQAYQVKKANYNPTASKIEQLALTRYLSEGHMDRHLHQLRKRYAQKYQMMKMALETLAPEWEWVLDETALRIHVKKTSMEQIPRQQEVAYDETNDELIFSFGKIKTEEILPALTMLLKKGISS